MPTAHAGETISIPLEIGGQFSAGDPTTIPNGTSRSVRNYLFRPNRTDGRPPWLYDSLDAPGGLARWEDLTNQRTTTVAMDATKLYKKPTTGTGWDAGTAGTIGTRLTDFANFMGKLYVMFDNGSGVPNGALVFDGTNISSTPFNSPIFGRTITPFIERVFIAYPRVTVSPLTPNTDAYDWTNTARWVTTNVNISNVTLSTGVTVCRLSPTSTATSGCSVRSRASAAAPESGILSLSAATTDTFVVWRGDFRGVDSLYDVPVTVELVLWTFKQSTQAYNVGDLLAATAADGNSYRYRVTVAGTTGVGVVLGSTIGGTTVDGTVTWLNQGSNVVAAVETTIPNISSTPDGVTVFVLASIPAHTNTTTLTPRLKFYNTLNPALTTLAPIDISLKDGIADGDLRKANRGQQWTLGDTDFPFFNCETATSATVDLDQIIFSEINQPKRILAKNYVTLPEVAGLPTAAAVVGGRYIVFKRRGMWQFMRTSDPNIPILPERPAVIGMGCLGPRALDTWMDELFWIGEDEIYRMRIGEDPKPICGPGMREAILTQGSAWCESQSSGKMPLLAIDPKNKEVWVYTQLAKLFVYNLETERWSTVIFLDGVSPIAIRSLLFDTIGRRMLLSMEVNNGVHRLDESSSANDALTSSGTLLPPVVNTITFKTIEAFVPERFELQLEGVDVYHNATATPTAGDIITLLCSLDRGVTFTVVNGPNALDTSDALIPLPLVTMGHSITLKLTREGSGGAAKWSISKAMARVKVLSGEYYYVAG